MLPHPKQMTAVYNDKVASR